MEGTNWRIKNGNWFTLRRLEAENALNGLKLFRIAEVTTKELDDPNFGL
jgi:hypothetical protein|tara:strand:+ start:702 stop:848 length:147 start_codon:yes stop_codon:yes gene_type:complete